MKNTGVKKALFAFLWLTAAVQVFADETFSENGFTYTIMKDNSSLSLESYQATTKTGQKQPDNPYVLPCNIEAGLNERRCLNWTYVLIL